MRAVAAGLALCLVAGLVWLIWGGLGDDLSRWAASQQRAVQEALAGHLRGLRAGTPGALTAFMGVCFAYGFFHAAGPGHGKVVIGGYGVARRIKVLRLSLVAVVASLGQAVTAIVLVAVGFWVFRATTAQMTGLAEDWFAPVSAAAILCLGGWLMVRGALRLRPQRAEPAPAHARAHSHEHVHAHGQACDTCGHVHAPGVHQVEAAGSLRELAALVGAVAVRPCTGALFVLILGIRLQIEAAAVAGVVAMALGTASVTVLVAVLATTLRESSVQAAGGWTQARQFGSVLEIAAGAVVMLLAWGLLRAGL